jgi:endonuclease/exonuclease/phosphatase family metal-dependent hydrolase
MTRRRVSPGLRTLLTFAIAIALGRLACPRDSEPLVLGTFNIEMFPRVGTDRAAVVDALVELDATVVALQEIRDPFALEMVLWLASQRAGRDCRVLMAPCGGNGVLITNALVWDASRVRLAYARPFPALDASGTATCRLDVQPALLGVFERDGGERFGVLTVHLNAFPHGFARRREQWTHVLRILARARADLGIPVLALGDFNSTGFRGEPAEERGYVQGVVDAAGFSLPTRDIPCTEYWRPQGKKGRFEPSILDHAVATDGSWAAEPLGMCARLRCEARPAGKMDPAWSRVSDHCPVRVHGQLR